MIKHLIAFLFCLPLCAGVLPDDWRTRDTVLECTWQALNICDWLQTRQLPDYYRGERHSSPGMHLTEGNPLMGRRPSRARIDATMLLGAATHFWLSTQLSRKSRTGFQILTIGTTFYCVRGNYQLGIRVTF